MQQEQGRDFAQALSEVLEEVDAARVREFNGVLAGLGWLERSMKEQRSKTDIYAAPAILFAVNAEPLSPADQIGAANE